MAFELLGTGDSGEFEQEEIKAAPSNAKSPKINITERRFMKITLFTTSPTL